MFLVTEIARLHEIRNAPKIEQTILQRRTGEGQPDLTLHLLHRLCYLRAGILNELRFVQHDGVEFVRLQILQIAAEQRVVGDHDIVIGNLLAHPMPRRAALQH